VLVDISLLSKRRLGWGGGARKQKVKIGRGISGEEEKEGETLWGEEVLGNTTDPGTGSEHLKS